MLKTILMTSAALAVCASTALAADLPSRRAPPVYAPPPIPIFSWTGFYIGGQVGYNFGKDSDAAVSTVTGVGFASSASNRGVIGGAHIGYNFSTQSLPLFGSFAGSLLGAGGVIGVEGDVDGSGGRATTVLGDLTATSRDRIQGSARGRLGFAVDRALFYATGGAAFGGLRNGYLNTVTGGFDTFSKTRVGYTVGGGVEYAFTNNWSLRVEYRYTDFGRNTDALAASAGLTNTVTHRVTDNRVQAGFSYKFDTFAAAPVVARY